MMKIFFLFFLIFNLTFSFAQNLSEFKNTTWVDKITCVQSLSDNNILFGSWGGIVNYNPQQGNHSILNATNKIYDLTISCIEKIDEEKVIVGTQTGMIYLIDINDGKSTKYYSEIAGNSIADFKVKDDTLWVASNSFIAVYKIENYNLEFVDFFSNFPESFDRFLTISVFRNKVFVGNTQSLFSAPSDYGKHNLKDKNMWKAITLDSIYSTVRVNDIDNDSQKLFLATNRGLFSLIPYNNNYDISKIKNGDIKKIRIDDGKIYWAALNKIYSTNNIVDETVFTANSTILDFAINNSNYYTVTNLYGTYTSEDSVHIKKFSTIPSNTFGAIVKNSSGDYYMANSPNPITSASGAVKIMKDKSLHYIWKGPAEYKWYRMNIIRYVKEVVPGQIIICTWGGGFWIIDENEDKFLVMNTQIGEAQLEINEYDGDKYKQIIVPSEKIEYLPNQLTDISDNPYYSIVSFAITDYSNNYVWISQFKSENNLVVLGFPIINEKVDWTDTTSLIKIYQPNGFSHSINTIEIDYWGNLWLGSDDKGCAFINLKNYIKGQRNWNIINESDYLSSNDIRYIKTDKDGYVWIATASGINVWTGSDVFAGRGNSQPIGLNIDYIYIDQVGNRWFATDKGISILKYYAAPWYSDDDWVHYVSEAEESSSFNMPGVNRINLPVTDFKSILVDEDKNKVIVGSFAGLLESSKLSALPAFSDKEKIVAFPNPINFNKGQKEVYFKNVIAGANIKILSINGKMIRELNFNNSSEFQGFWGKWDGKDSSGKLVPSGVYIFAAYTLEGKVSRGKIFVIN